ncbi:MAG: hypothetical protein CME62_12360 [Halobacteriovoraceae bacterium]|nr:hypothetical protein [Halobacteriovoraceae bacterium]|tara:strand:+ start:10210 stop:11076 length:867 start_codon:yes stop_codon:yes gene_type:complete
MKLILCFLLLLTQAAFAGDIVVLTSLDIKDKKLSKIERYVYDYYSDRTQDIKVIHEADATILSHYLNSPNTEKLFWVSHAGASRSMGTGISAQDTVLDIHGNNIKNLFSTVHPNLNFLAIVGCQAKGMLDDFYMNHNYQNNDNMNLFSFYKKVKLYRGVKMALQASLTPDRNILVTKVEDQIKADEVMQLTLSKQSAGVDSLVEIGDKSYVFPADKEILNIEIPKNVWDQFKSKNVKHSVLEKEIEDESHYVLAPIIVSSNTLKKVWKPFAKPNGELLGTYKHLYLLK